MRRERNRTLLRWIIGGLLMILAGVIGWTLADLTLGQPVLPGRSLGTSPLVGGGVKREGSWLDPTAPPFFLFVPLTDGTRLSTSLNQIRYAAGEGFHQYVLRIRAPWAGQEDIRTIQQTLTQVVDIDPRAVFILDVDLTPPSRWFSQHRGQAAVYGEQEQPFASVASRAWLQTAQASLALLVTEMERSAFRGRVLGYGLCALEQGRWYYSRVDSSAANLIGFQDWLRRHYQTEEAFRAAWNAVGLTFTTATLPKEDPSAVSNDVFRVRSEEQPAVDYAAYISDAVSDAIASLAAYVKAKARQSVRVYVSYGTALESPAGTLGHLGLGSLVNSEVDGFFMMVSQAERALVRSGGPSAPVDSLLAHGKQVLLWDDTRTGVSRDPSSGEVQRLAGLRREDVYSVQMRNFALAWVYGLGVVWADPEGEGRLHDPEQWKHFAQWREAYLRVRDGVRPEGTEGKPGPDTYLALVVDESSQVFQRPEASLFRLSLLSLRDAVLRAGVPVRFYALQDVIDGTAPQAAGYLFANAFSLSEEERSQLHQRLSTEKAPAFWIYAPGYVADTASAANIAATVRMNVVALEGLPQPGSRFALDGEWASASTTFGAEQTYTPVFAIDDTDADPLAVYVANNKVSAAARVVPEGWSSVYFAEPILSPAVLRETLRIYDFPISARGNDPAFYDTMYVGNRLLAIHAAGDGERTIALNRFCDIQDVFTAGIAWAQRESFPLTLKNGETRIFEVRPIPNQP